MKYLNQVRAGASACVINDKVYVFGGQTQDNKGKDSDTIQVFTIPKKRWNLFHLKLTVSVFESSALQVSPTEIVIIGGGTDKV